jgi:hypothetical protein
MGANQGVTMPPPPLLRLADSCPPTLASLSPPPACLTTHTGVGDDSAPHPGPHSQPDHLPLCPNTGSLQPPEALKQPQKPLQTP